MWTVQIVFICLREIHICIDVKCTLFTEKGYTNASKTNTQNVAKFQNKPKNKNINKTQNTHTNEQKSLKNTKTST